MTDLSTIAALATPLQALVDLDAFDRNAAWVETQAHGKSIRVGSKSIRTPMLLHRLLQRRNHIGVLAFSVREAGYLIGQGVKDVVVAYPTAEVDATVDAAKVAFDHGAQLTFMVDGFDNAAIVSEAARKLGRALQVAIDIDVSLDVPALRFGVLRSPVTGMATLAPLVDVLLKNKMLSLVGAMTYEAQLSGVGDRNNGPLNPVVRMLKKRSRALVIERRNALLGYLRQQCDLRFVNAGGTGCLDFSAGDANVTEITAGSAYFAPHVFDHYDDFSLQPAAFFALQVVRKATPNSATCAGGGYVASGEPGWNKVPIPVFPRGLKLSPHEAAGEVQTPLLGVGAKQLAVGDLVLFRHAKAGELAEHFLEFALVQAGKKAGSAPTYRGLGFRF